MAPSFIDRVTQLARSPQGRRLAEDTVRRARDPKTRRQIDQVRAGLARRTGRSRAAQ